MKTFKNIIICFSAIIVLSSSCKKDFLDPKIYDQFSENNFLKTENDIKSAVTPYYSLFGTDWGAYDLGSAAYLGSFNVALGGYDYQTSKLTDVMFDYWQDPPLGLFRFGSATFNSRTQTTFYNRIQFVARATDLIDRISKLSDIAPEVKNQYLGEVKAMRAWLMYILYDLYGPLNPILDPAELSNLQMKPKMSAEEYIKAMEKDLLEAIALIPKEKYNADANNWGRISKGTARMILLRMYVNTAKTPADWQKAKVIGTDIVNMGYSLMPSYKDVFTAKANNELIYATPGNSGTFNWWFKLVMPANSITVAGVNVRPGWFGMGMNWKFYEKYQTGDRRLETIADRYRNDQGRIVDRSNGLLAAIPMKYTRFVPNDAGYDWIVFRYADVLLYMAEITNQLNGPTSEALGYLKQVTDRANATIPVDATENKQKFQDYVIEERGKELYFENGNRRSDLIRNGTLISNAIARGRTDAKPFHVLFPIPADIIIQSNGVIAQNNGY